nr:DUF4241 domain-containing protein [Kribbella sandramycini]
MRVPNGKLEACDPFVTLGEGPVVDVPAGDYPAYVTVADVSDAQDGSHLREAYLSLRFAEGEVAAVEAATNADEELGEDEFWMVAVDAGTVGFVDAEAVRTLMPEGDWYEDLFENGRDDSWFALMDSPEHLIEGCANIVLPLATEGENLVLAHSGWGDGAYPLVRTVDAAGRTLGIHIDLLVVGPESDDQ